MSHKSHTWRCNWHHARMPNGHTTPTPRPAFAPPVPSQFAAHFTDARGSEDILIHNDGSWLRTTLRGVALAGQSLDDFEPVDPPSAAALTQLTLSPQGELCGCELRFDLPLPLMPLAGGGGEVLATLQVHLDLGAPTAHSLTHERLSLALAWTSASGSQQRVTAQTNSGWFETALLDLQAQLRTLPEQLSIKACISCQYSDYSPYGNGLFGSMLCFRNIAAEYSQVSDKASFWTVLDRFERQVQETDLCPQFAPRKPGTGYRG